MTNDQITRRGFLKKSALTGIAVAAGAVVAKMPEVTKAAPVPVPEPKVPKSVQNLQHWTAVGSGGYMTTTGLYLYEDRNVVAMIRPANTRRAPR